MKFSYFCKMKTLEEIVKKHAFKCHSLMNHIYDPDGKKKDYSFHLKMVRDIGEFFKEYISKSDREDVYCALFEHDTLEDCEIICSFDDLAKVTNTRIASIVKAVTTGKGSRKERFSDEYYDGIRNTEYATFVKLCDRIANVRYGLDNNNSVVKMYKKEHPHFKEKLYVKGEYENMWSLLDYLISTI